MKESSRENYREASRINIEFWGIVRGFEESLHGRMFIREMAESDHFYIRYDNIWRNFCKHWSIGYNRILKPNENAFRQYAKFNMIETITYED